MNRMVKLRSTLLSQNQFFKQPLFKSENAENPSTSLLLRIMEDKGSHDYLPLWLIDHLLSAPHSSLILFYLSECAAVSVPMASNYHARGIFRLLTQADVTMQTFSFRENIGQNKVFKYTLDRKKCRRPSSKINSMAQLQAVFYIWAQTMTPTEAENSFLSCFGSKI